MRCKGCGYHLSLTERRRGQRYCNRCEGILIERFADALRYEWNVTMDKMLRGMIEAS